MRKIKLLKWESGFFNRKIYFLENFSVDFNEKEYDLIQSKVNLKEKDKIETLEKKGFHLEELNVTFRKKIKSNNINFNYTKAKNLDIEKLLPLAQNIEKSRFNLYGKDKVIKFYQEWIINSVNSNFDDVCFFIEEEGKVLGLITIKEIESSLGRIGLIIIKKDSQGKGIGRKMLEIGENYCLSKNLKEIEVSTQGTNLRAQKFYNKNGYYINNIEAWYYLNKEGNR